MHECPSCHAPLLDATRVCGHCDAEVRPPALAVKLARSRWFGALVLAAFSFAVGVVITVAATGSRLASMKTLLERERSRHVRWRNTARIQESTIENLRKRLAAERKNHSSTGAELSKLRDTSWAREKALARNLAVEKARRGNAVVRALNAEALVAELEARLKEKALARNLALEKARRGNAEVRALNAEARTRKAEARVEELETRTDDQ